MTPKVYQQQAQRTSAPISHEVLVRLTDKQVLQSLIDNFTSMKVDGHDLDAIKKHVFYGKEIDPDCLPNIIGDNEEESKLFASYGKLLHGLIGIGTEYAELLENLFHNNFDPKNIEEEIGDLLWYIAETCAGLDLDLGYIMHKNITKLEHRYPEKFSHADALARKDKMCPRCFGKGVTYIDIDTERMLEEITCENCNGTGAVK